MRTEERKKTIPLQKWRGSPVLLQRRSHNATNTRASKKAWLICFAAIEFVICILNGLLLCSIGFLHTYDIRGYWEYPCDFQCELCFGAFFLFPLLMILSLLRPLLRVIKYGFLIIGCLFILSGIVVSLFYMVYFINWGENIHDVQIRFPLMMLTSIWGIGSIIRYWSSTKYNKVLFLVALIENIHRGSRVSRFFLSIIAFYLTVYIILWFFLVARR